MTQSPFDLSLTGEPLPTFAQAPSAPMGHSPLRRPGSVRRTATLDAHWPDGDMRNTVFHGHARDILTPPAGGAPILLSEDRARVVADQRVIREVASEPARPNLDQLEGATAGSHLRSALDDVLHGERVAAAPLYLLLDDLAGATLIAAWALSVWHSIGWDEEQMAAHVRGMEGVCIGFRPGSTALGTSSIGLVDQNVTPVEPLLHPDDPAGWHELIERAPINFRRARRIDVWREEGLLRIESAFQDSSSLPGGGRIALHEYRLSATADAAGQSLLALDATPGTLPYRECPAAVANIGALVGTPLCELRETVLNRLRKTAGCTHLNDMLRSLADVPRLADQLPLG